MASRSFGPPSEQYLLALAQELHAFYKIQDDQIERHRRVRTLAEPVPIDDLFKLTDIEVRDPSIWDEDQHVASLFSVNPPKLTITPTIPGSDTGEENASLREHWTEEVLRQAAKGQPGMDSYARAWDACVGDGAAWSKLVFAKDIWDERYKVKKSLPADEYLDKTEAAKKAAGPPFRWIIPDVATVYPVFANGQITEVLEYQRRPLWSTLRQYRLTLDDAGNIVPDVLGEGYSYRFPIPTTAWVDFIEHWDNTWATYLVIGSNAAGNQTAAFGRSPDGRTAQWKHGYGRVPYFYAPGLSTAFWHNRKVGWPVSEAKRYLVENRSYLDTLLSNVAAREVFAPLKRTRAPNSLPVQAQAAMGNTRQPAQSERWDPKTIVDMQPGEDLLPMGFPPIVDSLREAMARNDERIKELSAPRIGPELGANMEGAGLALIVALTEVRVRYAPLATSLQNMLEEMTLFLWDLMRRKVKETVFVYVAGEKGGWLGAGPEDLSNTVGVKWEVDAELPSAKLVEWRLGHERLQAGTIDLDTLLTSMGENPSEIRLGKMRDDIRQQPWYKQALYLHTLQTMGRGDMLAGSAEVQQIVATGGRPMPSGNGVVPDMGQMPGVMPSGLGAGATLAQSGGPGPTAGMPQAAMPPQASVAPGMLPAGRV